MSLVSTKGFGFSVKDINDCTRLETKRPICEFVQDRGCVHMLKVILEKNVFDGR